MSKYFEKTLHKRGQLNGSVDVNWCLKPVYLKGIAD